jgi:NAD(P)-dependent dehydrogenase (short-subunit alcohol dehydrogenase family)
MTESRRVVIITGASQGIGAGLVAGFRQAGYAVLGTSRSIGAVDQPDYLTVPGDITQADTAQRVVTRALDHFGRVDTLINNAGVFIGKAFTDYTADDFAAVTSVNLAGFFHVTQRVIAPMIAQGGGHIVNISTSLVDHPDRSTPAALTALTKGGLAAVTRSLAAEYAASGVRVNAVSPGVIQTPAHDASSYAGLAGRVPLGRLGGVNDIVEAIFYLDRAPFVTGEILHVDGGQAAGD